MVPLRLRLGVVVSYGVVQLHGYRHVIHVARAELVVPAIHGSEAELVLGLALGVVNLGVVGTLDLQRLNRPLGYTTSGTAMA